MKVIQFLQSLQKLKGLILKVGNHYNHQGNFFPSKNKGWNPKKKHVPSQWKAKIRVPYFNGVYAKHAKNL
jgi:hypothetical protein